MRRLPLWVFALCAMLLASEAWARGSRSSGGRGGGPRAGGARRSGGSPSYSRGSRSYGGARSYGAPRRSGGSRSFSRGSRGSSTSRPRSYAPRSYAPRSYGTRGAGTRSPGTRSFRSATAPRSYGRRAPATTRTPRPRSFDVSRRARTSTPRATRSPNSRYRYVNRTPSRSGRSRDSAVGRTAATRANRSRPAVASPRTATRTRTSTAGRRSVADASRYGYRGRHTHVAPVRHTHYHVHYHRGGYYCSWHFGHGRYYGCRYYWPYYNYCTGRHIAFFYAAPVTWVYVPFGFYDEYEEPAYVTTKDGIDEEYAREHRPERYESEEYDPEKYAEETDATAKPENKPEDPKEVDPEPAADSPTTEKFLREASAAFHAADYDAAAKKFRLAAVSAPENAAPLFALGQALVALGRDDYAARVIRRAVVLSPQLLDEPGDLVGVYKNQAEFDRILGDLAGRAATSDQARFLLGVQRYFTGDPRARAIFSELAKADPTDRVVERFVAAVEKRFKAASDLPPIK